MCLGFFFSDIFDLNPFIFATKDLKTHLVLKLKYHSDASWDINEDATK